MFLEHLGLARTHLAKLTSSIEKRRTVKADTAAQVATWKADASSPFALYSDAEQRRLADAYEKRLETPRTLAARRDLYLAEEAVSRVAPLVAQARTAAMRPATIEEAWRQRSKSAGVDAATHLQLKAIGLQARLLLNQESASWSVHEWRSRYERALEDPTEIENAALVQFTEEKIASGGWRGQLDERGLTVAHQFKQFIADVREARVPDTVRTAEAEIATMARAIQRAKDVDGLIPLNPERLGAAETALLASVPA